MRHQVPYDLYVKEVKAAMQRIVGWGGTMGESAQEVLDDIGDSDGTSPRTSCTRTSACSRSGTPRASRPSAAGRRRSTKRGRLTRCRRSTRSTRATGRSRSG